MGGQLVTGGEEWPQIDQHGHTDLNRGGGVGGLHVEYAEREKEYGMLFISSLFCECMRLEYELIHVIYRVTQAEYVIHILVVAP